MPFQHVLKIESAALVRGVRRTIERLPPLSGAPVAIQMARGLRDRRGDVHGAAFLRKRRMALDCSREEFPRIFVHELFHFVWLRLGNVRRRSYEELLRKESHRGELGWSAEWRRKELRAADIRSRSRCWREYCCESFCDTAAWIYSGIHDHEEFTLDARCRKLRRKWFDLTIGSRGLSI